MPFRSAESFGLSIPLAAGWQFGLAECHRYGAGPAQHPRCPEPQTPSAMVAHFGLAAPERLHVEPAQRAAMCLCFADRASIAVFLAQPGGGA
jgi:hypothetical protein